MRFNVLMVGFIIAASTASVTSVMAAEGGYFGANVGISKFRNSDIEVTRYTYYGPYSAKGELSYDTGTTVGVSLGYDFSGYRLEGEYAYRSTDYTIPSDGYSNSVSGGDASISSLMVNGLVDTNPTGEINPFFGAGVGILRGDMDSDKDTTLGYQFTAGLGAKASEKLFFDFIYRYQAATRDFDTKGVTLSYASNNFSVGLRAKF